MNQLEQRRRDVTAARLHWGDPDPRREKRWFRREQSDHAVYVAYLLGADVAHRRRRPARNPYPPGRRHDEFERGFADVETNL